MPKSFLIYSIIRQPPTPRSAAPLPAGRSCLALVVEPVSRDHDRERFDCGVEALNALNALNAFPRQTARQHQDRGISRTFVSPDLHLVGA